MHCCEYGYNSVLILIFAAYDANQKELKGNSCQVEQFPGLFPRDMRSIEVLLIQEAQGEARREALSQNQAVATLQCVDSGNKVTVNLQDSEESAKVRYTLKSLSVITALLQDNLTEPHCYLSTAPKLWFQAGLHLTVQDTDEDLLLRKRWSIMVKALVAITLLISGIAITVFVIFEVPCPCACPGARKLCRCQQWRRQKKDGMSGEPQPRATRDPITGKPEKECCIFFIIFPICMARTPHKLIVFGGLLQGKGVGGWGGVRPLTPGPRGQN
ncbi:uncharacterized protein C17orf78 homolog [Notamacropus eugenii]|uniref:uncharacterized protein C17orf78 homolog n=1 Tax=Notamacropus eugenii TaxID=9315 RepID=UPI003B6764E5